MATTLARGVLCLVVLLASGCSGAAGEGGPDARDGVPSPPGPSSAVSPLPATSYAPVPAPASPCASLDEQLVRRFTPAEQTDFAELPPSQGQNSVSLSCEWSSLSDEQSGRLKVQVTRVGPEPGLSGAERAARVHGRCGGAQEKPVLEDLPGGRPGCFTRRTGVDEALSLELRGSAGDQLVVVSAYRAPGTQLEAELLDAAQDVLRHALSLAL